LGTRLSRKLAVHRERRERGAPLVTQCTPEMLADLHFAPALVISLVALAIALGGVASAAIPDSNGIINACYNVNGQGEVGSNATLRVIDPTGGGNPDTTACKNGEQGLTWNSGAALGTDTGTAFSTNGGALCTIGQVTLTASHSSSVSVGVVANGIPANGQLLQIQNFPALYALIGTTYGGNGTTTFALPDLRSITPNHMTYSICTAGVFPSPS